MGCRSRRFSPSQSSLTCVRFLKGSLEIWDLPEIKSGFGETQNVLMWHGISLVLGKQDLPKSWHGMWYWETYDFQDRADRSLGCEIVVKKELECRIRTFLPVLVVSIKDNGQWEGHFPLLSTLSKIDTSGLRVMSILLRCPSHRGVR